MSRESRAHQQTKALVSMGLLGLVTVALSACAADGPPGASSSGVTRVSDQAPVEIPGVEPCAQVVRSQSTSRAAAVNALADRELDCLSDGPSVNVAAPTGETTVINLWASWCGPCREEMPLLQREFERRHGQVTFIGVDTRDESEAAADFLEAVAVTYPQLSDPEAGLLGDARSPGLPVTLVLGADGELVMTKIGPFESQTELGDAIDEATDR